MSGKSSPSRRPIAPATMYGIVCSWIIAVAAGERHENGDLIRRVVSSIAEFLVHRHNLPVACTVFPGGGEPLPGGLEEVELVMEVALHKDSLTAIDLRSR